MRDWVWICEDCSWAWPRSGVPFMDAECDNCGGHFVREDPAAAPTGGEE